MALFNNTSGGIPLPDNAKPPEEQDNVFHFVPTSLAQGAQTTIQGMFDGSAMDAARARTNEALARSAQQYRASSAGQFAPVVGQGAALRAQQGVERDVMQQVADTQLGFAEQAQQLKQQAVGATMEMERLGMEGTRDIFSRQMKSVDILLTSGQFDEAADTLGEMFPGVEFDFSNQQLSASMDMLSHFVATGLTTERAMALAAEQGLPQALGMSAEDVRGIYENMLRQANPMLATIDQLTTFGQMQGLDEAAIDSMVGGYMQTLTGMEMAKSDDGTWRVVPNDGYARVTSLANVQAGDMVKFSTPLYTPDGVPIPPGSYNITETTKTKEDKNAWTGEVETTTTTTVWAVDANGRKYQVKKTKDKSTNTSGSGLQDLFWPL